MARPTVPSSNYESFLASHNLQPAQLDIPCQPKILLSMVTVITQATAITQWQLLAQALDLTSAEIADIEREEEDEKEKKSQVFEVWCHKSGLDATYLKLMEEIFNLNNTALANCCMDILKSSITTSNSLPNVSDELQVMESKYPFQKWTEMTEMERTALFMELENNVKKIMQSYTSMFFKIKRSFVRKVDFRDLKMFLEICGLVDPDKIADIRKAKDVTDLMVIVCEHSSWIYPQLLENLVDELGDQNDQKIVKNYVEEVLKPFLSKSILEIPSQFYNEDPSESYQFILKIPDTSIQTEAVRGQDLLQIIRYVAQRLDIPSLKPISICAGCVKVELLLPKKLYKNLIDHTSNNSSVEWKHSTEGYEAKFDLTDVL